MLHTALTIQDAGIRQKMCALLLGFHADIDAEDKVPMSFSEWTLAQCCVRSIYIYIYIYIYMCVCVCVCVLLWLRLLLPCMQLDSSTFFRFHFFDKTGLSVLHAAILAHATEEAIMFMEKGARVTAATKVI